MLMPEREKIIRDYCNAATPGPWKNDCGNGQIETENERVVICNRMGNYDRREDAKSMYGGRPLPQKILDLLEYDNESDMDFIAMSRTAIPELLAAIDRLREENKGLLIMVQNAKDNRILKDSHFAIQKKLRLAVKALDDVRDRLIIDESKAVLRDGGPILAAITICNVALKQIEGEK